MKNLIRADKNLIKQINTVSILKVIRENGPISRADISKVTGLNPATVSSNTLDLLERRLIKEIGSGESSGGRKPIMLTLNTEDIYFLGVDMGIQKVTTGLIDINGEVINKVAMNYGEDTSFENVFTVIKESINSVIKIENISIQKVTGMGMGVHGLVDTENGKSIYTPAFNWNEIDMVSILEEEFAVPVIIDNDVRAMALGEKWFGAAKNSENFILINIGTGIGAGIYLNGDLFHGNGFGAGEIGHVSISSEDVKCKCGNSGCFEALASGPAIVKRFKKKLKKGYKSSITEKYDLEKINSKLIYLEAKNGDDLSKIIFEETGEYIGLAISMLINILNPDMVLIAGGIYLARELFEEKMHKVIKEKTLKNNYNKTYIGGAQLKENVGIIGAAALVIRELFNVS